MFNKLTHSHKCLIIVLKKYTGHTSSPTMFEYTGHEGHLPSANGRTPQSTEPKVEEKRSYRCSPAVEEHLNSCLHLQTQDAKHHTCLTIRDRFLFTKDTKPQSNNKTLSSSSTPQASCPEVRPLSLENVHKFIFSPILSHSLIVSR